MYDSWGSLYVVVVVVECGQVVRKWRKIVNQIVQVLNFCNWVQFVYCYVQGIVYDGLFLDVGIKDVFCVVFFLQFGKVLVDIVDFIDIFFEGKKFWLVVYCLIEELIEDFIFVQEWCIVVVNGRVYWYLQGCMICLVVKVSVVMLFYGLVDFFQESLQVLLFWCVELLGGKKYLLDQFDDICLYWIDQSFQGIFNVVGMVCVCIGCQLGEISFQGFLNLLNGFVVLFLGLVMCLFYCFLGFLFQVFEFLFVCDVFFQQLVFKFMVVIVFGFLFQVGFGFILFVGVRGGMFLWLCQFFYMNQCRVVVKVGLGSVLFIGFV